MRNDTRQLEAIISVLGTFVDAGVEVWLRFAVGDWTSLEDTWPGYPAKQRRADLTPINPQHEANWYTRESSDFTDRRRGQYYAGGAADFVDAFRSTVETVRAALPIVKHMWSPNVRTLPAVWLICQRVADVIDFDSSATSPS